MKFLTRKDSIARKILIILLVALILIFAITPNYNVQATEEIVKEDMPDEGEGILGSLLKEIIQLIVALGDIVMGTLNHFMVGADGFTSAMIAIDNDNMVNPDDGSNGNPNSWLYVSPDEDIDFAFGTGTIDTANFFSWLVGDQFNIPNFLYSPEAIFANNIAALDINFLNPNNFSEIADTDRAREASESAAGGELRQIIADWYVSFRNIAIVGLLSVLVYLGIRILISSTSVDKAKYKESLQSWVVALCLVFLIHFIMSGLLMLTDKFNDLFGDNINDITVSVDSDSHGEVRFRTNIIGLLRFNAQSISMYNVGAYSILYLMLVIYTVIFTFIYFKRFLYMAFLTMIAPLVALTYPIDKAGDGHAQAFNMWFKEYTMNLILQPVHLILYVALVSSAMELVKQNMIYAVVAIGFLIPAEKFIKKMFGFDKAETPGGFGSFAAGAATMTGLKQVASMLGSGKDKNSNQKTSTATDRNTNNSRVRTQDRGFLSSFRNGENDRNLPEGNNSNIDINEGQQLEPRGSLQQEQQTQQIGENPSRGRLTFNEGFAVDNEHNGIALPSTYYQDQQQQTAREQREGEQQAAREQAAREQAAREQAAREQAQRSQQLGGTIPGVRPERKEGWVKNRAIRGIKKVGKVAYKGAKLGARGLGIAGGAMIGLAAGAATGDFSNALTYMGAGAVAGNKLGKGLGNLPESTMNLGIRAKDSLLDRAEEYQYNRDKDLYGVGYAAEQSAIRQNQREEARFLNNKEEQEKYEEMAGRIRTATQKNVNTEDLMRAAYDYKKAGITDEKQIEKGLTMEAKHDQVNGNIHDNMIDVVNMTNSYGKDYVLDEKKRNSMQEMIRANVSRKQDQDKVWQLYTDTLGMAEMGEKYAINPPQRQQSTQEQRGNGNSSRRVQNTPTPTEPRPNNTLPPRQHRPNTPPQRPSSN